jgi:hypothetical protein
LIGISSSIRRVVLMGRSSADLADPHFPLATRCACCWKDLSSPSWDIGLQIFHCRA